MGETTNTTNATTEKAPKKSWFKGIKSEFKKIIWPDKEYLGKQAIAVLSVTIVLGIVIYVLDYAIELGLKFLL
ncbi:MAG: putative rane protein [Herbinix sp.]|jgi:preprotein translocase subunit SecE|nr:putative rane protein [Herbinix sp.]